MSGPVRIKLAPVTASGRREGWWFHVKGVATGRKAGFRRFEGDRLAVGECELPPMAVVLLVRPTGSARSDDRVADLMYLDPALGGLNGIAFGLDWSGAGSEQLRVAVGSALLSQQRYEETCARINETLAGWVGKPATPEAARRIAEEMAALISQTIPAAIDVEVAKHAYCDRLEVKFTLPSKDCVRIINCAVPCINSMGEEDFCFVCIHVPPGYVNNEEDPESGEPHHHEAARIAAGHQGYDGITRGYTPVYDDTDNRWVAIHGMFDWGTAIVYNLSGEVA